MAANANKIALTFLVVITVNCWLTQKSKNMKNASTNKEFVYEMISKKKRLEDYPERISESMTVYEPSSLPFGGVYRGFRAYEQFYPKVRAFYDFSKFSIENIYGDAEAVFVLIDATIAKTSEPLKLCEHFRFDSDGKVVEVRLYLYDYENKPVHRIIACDDQTPQ